MTKAYISKQTVCKKENVLDFAFEPQAEEAVVWFDKQSAEIDCNYYKTLYVRITSPDGMQHYVANDFAVEELATDKFVIFCTVPWSEQVKL
jgi:hypothetical protein